MGRGEVPNRGQFGCYSNSPLLGTCHLSQTFLPFVASLRMSPGEVAKGGPRPRGPWE